MKKAGYYLKGKNIPDMYSMVSIKDAKEAIKQAQKDAINAYHDEVEKEGSTGGVFMDHHNTYIKQQLLKQIEDE